MTKLYIKNIRDCTIYIVNVKKYSYLLIEIYVICFIENLKFTFNIQIIISRDFYIDLFNQNFNIFTICIEASI